ncbi:ferrous iron transporter B [Cyclobacteriaceae bacterium]|nr:ferrous iron transporter B [Cyclobacteriaceae bacterium]
MDKSIALIGSPNCGKTSLFNSLTGLNHKVGNFPGVTVDKKTGNWKTAQNTYKVIDLPGTYSLHPKSMDEKVVIDYLNSEQRPEVLVVVIDATNIRRNLLLLSQVATLNLPMVAAFNMMDLAEERNISIDLQAFTQQTGVAAVAINAREGKVNGLEEVIDKAHVARLRTKEVYLLDLYTINSLEEIKSDTQSRFHEIDTLLPKFLKEEKGKSFSQRFDKVLLHPVFGYFIFFGLLTFIFQLLFTVSSYPMDMIEQFFGFAQSWVLAFFGEGPLVRLVAEGIIAGIGGVVIFIPQIAFLFLFLSLLEESGYMARVVFLMDKWMSKLGMSGRSVVPLISSTACAIPAVMGARTIKSTKERLITIFVAPLVSCSARLPVYAVFIAIIIPEDVSFGIFGLQGLLLMGLYLLGFVAAIVTALVMHLFVKFKDEQSLFALEMPEYRAPVLKNVLMTVYDKSMAFVLGAGKIILSISIVLWVLASYGPGDSLEQAALRAQTDAENRELNEAEKTELVTQMQLESSYIGIAGKSIEPVIKPLGYDWKIGVGLIASFAAREVFIGTLSTIYSIGSEDEGTIAERIKKERNIMTGQKVYTLATCMSILVFYVFAMQCMSTLAIVRKETNSWKWPMAQLVYMTALAYLGSLMTYNLLV